LECGLLIEQRCAAAGAASLGEGDGGGNPTSEGLRRLATVLPSLERHRPAGGCRRGACAVFDDLLIALPVWAIAQL